MKVNLYKTFVVTDEQRVQIANLADGKVTKRRAHRDEVKDFLWENGNQWDQKLPTRWLQTFLPSAINSQEEHGNE